MTDLGVGVRGRLADLAWGVVLIVVAGIGLSAGCDAVNRQELEPPYQAAAPSVPPTAAVSGPIPTSVIDEPTGLVTCFGQAGTGPADFSYPRSVAVDPNDGSIFVVDRRARVRQFDRQGRPIQDWTMPTHANGNPRAIRISSGGDLLVADTHYYRLAVFSRDGNLLRSFGTRSPEPGGFLFVTGVAEDPASGDLLVADYGDDVSRVQRFTAGGELVAVAGGTPGDEPGQMARPMGVAVGSDGRVFVADSCNHRVSIFSRDLAPLDSWVGFRYPYDIDVAEDGRVLVAEYGANRITLLSPEGKVSWRHGRPGRGPEDLATPWGVAFSDHDRRAMVTDSGNHRVVVLALP